MYLELRRATFPVVTTNCGPHRFTYTTRDEYIGSDLFLYGRWERHLTSLLPILDLEGMVAIDVGANIGTYTVRLSEAVGVKGEVIALEPDPQNAGWLRRNLDQNGCGNVRVVEAAAGDGSVTTAGFVIDLKNRGNHHVAVGGELTDRTVQVVTIDSLTDALSNDAVGFIKIDVQGFERSVLDGMWRTLERNSGSYLQMELNSDRDGRAAGIVQSLTEAGWAGVEVSSGRILDIQDRRAYEWPFFRGECDLLLARDEAALRSRLEAALS